MDSTGFEEQPGLLGDEAADGWRPRLGCWYDVVCWTCWCWRWEGREGPGAARGCTEVSGVVRLSVEARGSPDHQRWHCGSVVW